MLNSVCFSFGCTRHAGAGRGSSLTLGKEMLTPLKMPYVAERFLGVTIPDAGVMFACSYEGLHKITLEDPIRIETDDERSEDYDALRSMGEALGLFGGTPILADS